MNPYHPQRASTPQAAHQSSTRVTHEGRVLSSREVSPDVDDGTVPLILLRGRWLTRMGFRSGARIRIDVSFGRIVLTLVDPPPEGPGPVPSNFARHLRERSRRTDKGAIASVPKLRQSAAKMSRLLT